MQRRPFSTVRNLQHDNPLGIPRSGAPPSFRDFIGKRGLPEQRKIRGVNKVIAVSSAKGGVGKSTISANLALSFARQGLRSGILDTDIFGPSIPGLFNLSGEPRRTKNEQLIPLSNYGVKSMSMGYLVPEAGSIAWRGLMVTKAIQQLLHEVDWGGLDILVLDLPPGTGDVQLTITQHVKLDGAVVVSTPEDAALRVAVRGITLFNKVDVPVLGMIQNMSGPVHGLTGVSDFCAAHNITLLGDIPLQASILADAGRGKPTVVAEPESEPARAFHRITRTLAGMLDLPVSGSGVEGASAPTAQRLSEKAGRIEKLEREARELEELLSDKRKEIAQLKEGD
ncbi:hypothetical protein LTR04_007111 [Oleoguttula sp. CCFEE 6159]|nr:hypothetical protein LTR04_007111 [Oleoguttula sp. CCFEE 6159]